MHTTHRYARSLLCGWFLVHPHTGCSSPADADRPASSGTDGEDSPAPSSSDDPSGAAADSEGSDGGAPRPEDEGAADFPRGRTIRRLTADQFQHSLTVVTGQTWEGFAEYAAALGKPDFAEVTQNDRSLSVTFEKFAADAAIDVCRRAVEQDASLGGDTILQEATLADDDEELVRRNVQYLLLRFLATSVALDDPRIDPWAALVLAPVGADDPERARRDRWTAVCVGLATHVDFITY